MGIISVCPCLGRDPQEKVIAYKECSLMIQNFSIIQIKDAFFYKNDGDKITYSQVMKAMKKLTEGHSGIENLYKEEETEAKKNFKALLKGIIEGEPAEKFEENNFKFRSLMIMLIMMSKNISKDRIQGILQLEGKEKFNQEALIQSLGLIFKTVIDCSIQLILSDIDESKKALEIKRYDLYKSNIDTVVKASVEKILPEKTEKTPLELGIIFYQLWTLMQYDAATTAGIRKALKESVKAEEMQKIEAEEQELLKKKEEGDQKQQTEVTQGQDKQEVQDKKQEPEDKKVKVDQAQA